VGCRIGDDDPVSGYLVQNNSSELLCISDTGNTAASGNNIAINPGVMGRRRQITKRLAR
jgi:hypothetical protein